jgi:hypothetical protein
MLVISGVSAQCAAADQEQPHCMHACKYTVTQPLELDRFTEKPLTETVV